jgi:hypothetical protein
VCGGLQSYASVEEVRHEAGVSCESGDGGGRAVLRNCALSEVIRKTKHGYQVLSEAGKPLSADDLTKDEAEKRLAQVEMFKSMKHFAKKKLGGSSG